MFESLLRRLLGPAPESLTVPDSRLALATLLIRIARTDGLYAAAEVERIDHILIEHFQLDPFEAAKLRADAEEMETQAPDTVRFTRALKDATPLEEREVFLQAMWSVALADGQRDPGEDQLMRMVCSLLGLSDVQNAQARARARRDAD